MLPFRLLGRAIAWYLGMYSTWDDFKFGTVQFVLVIALLVPWRHCAMFLIGFDSRLG